MYNQLSLQTRGVVMGHPHHSLARPGKFDKNTFLVYFYYSNVFKKIYQYIPDLLFTDVYV